MERTRYAGRLVAVVVVGVLALALAAGGYAQTGNSGEQQGFPVDRQSVPEPKEEQPPVGITVILSVYSGRPNPTWTVEPGPELDRLAALLKGLKTTENRLFDYDEWNRLGYASFWVITRGLPGLPSQVHLWRDKAFVPAKEGKGSQAVGASALYEALVSEAEAKDFREFFRNYRKQNPSKGTTQ